MEIPTIYIYSGSHTGGHDPPAWEALAFASLGGREGSNTIPRIVLLPAHRKIVFFLPTSTQCWSPGEVLGSCGSKLVFKKKQNWVPVF